MNATLVKVDRNGSKHYEGSVKCDRCGGDGIYKWGAMINGRPQYIGTCFKCMGASEVFGKWIERTAEYQAKLDAKREAKHEQQRIKREAERREREEAERKEREERERLEAERKAVSQYVGNVGDKISMVVTLVRTASWEQPSFRGFGTDTCYAHIFKDSDGNVMTWKTTSALGLIADDGSWKPIEDGAEVKLTGRIKEHTVYWDEKQTMLTRCKVQRA